VHIDLATLSLLGALQALLLAPLLLAATRVYTGLARRSLRIWGSVLLLQALGWALLALRGHISDWFSIVLANGVLITSYAESARALRLLLKVPQRRRLLAAIGLGGWLLITWLWHMRPEDYHARVYAMALVAGSYLCMLLWPLRHAARPGGSNAQRAMLLVLLGACAAWLLRLGELGASPVPGQGLLTPTPANTLNLFYSALEPVLASIGFLLMYNETAQAELKRLARTDPLTGTLNRLALDEEAERLFRRSAGHGGECAVLMIDVDHFKVINDRYGHAGGDVVLMALAARIGEHLRHGDVLGRVGGEEFLMLLPDTGMNEATLVAEGLRTSIEDMRTNLDGEPQRVTISIGVAVREPTDPKFGVLIRRADRALYSAKRAGRNRVAVSHEPPVPLREFVDTL